jgi:transmembrane sensor
VADTPDISAQLSDKEWDRLARHLAGESSDADRVALDSWIAEHPERRTLMAALTETWRRTGALPSRTVDVDAAWRVTARRIASANAPAAKGPLAPSFAANRFRPFLAMAATLAILVGGYAAWRQVRSGLSITAPARSFATGIGERRSIQLGDSTEVILGVASRLDVAAGYGGKARELTLEGEALFRVRHDASRPFRVTAAGALTEDLGTEFTIRAYGPTDTVRVVVTEGSVALRAAGAATGGATIRAGESGILAPGGLAAVTPTPNGEAATAWTRGELAFRDAPLARVAEELGRWYDVEVNFADSALAARRLTTSFTGDSLGAVLRVIELTVGVRAERNGRVVTLRAGAPPR